MRKFYLLPFLCAIILILLSSSCWEKDTDGDKVIDTKDNCPEVPAKTNDGCPEKSVITNVKIFLETSASMGGYFNPTQSTEFKSIVSDLIGKIEENVKPVQIAFIADSTYRFNKSVSDFSREIATTSIAPQKSSQLHKIFDQISSETGKGNVSILISDCILSFPDQDIQRNPEINIVQADIALKGDMFKTFSKLKKKDYAASIYAFTSKFYGKYYDYQNVKTPLRGEKRPFYIWVIGQKDLVRQFNVEMKDISNFKPEKSLHFGLTDSTVRQYNIIPLLGKKGEWSKSSTGIEDIQTSNGEPIQFFVGLDLIGLPAYAQELSYLQKKLKVNGAGSIVKFEFRRKESFDKAKINGRQQSEQFQNATHILMVEVSNLDMSETKVRFSLPLESDTWFRAWSTMNDKDIKGRENRTFAFEHLIEGVLEAYDSRNKEFIDFSINLTKD